MATIAKLTKHEDGSFRGVLILPSLAGAEITFRPVENPTATGPAYRVYTGEFESGAAWRRLSKAGNAYLSIRLNDPTFDRKSIYPALLKNDSDEYSLDWTPPRRSKAAATTTKNTEF